MSRVSELLKSGDLVVEKVLLRPANADDLKIDNKNLRAGQVFWLRSSITKELEPNARVIDDNTDPESLAEWFFAGMIYVPFNTMSLDQKSKI